MTHLEATLHYGFWSTYVSPHLSGCPVFCFFNSYLQHGEFFDSITSFTSFVHDENIPLRL
jgi:hypothetical protein